jgi:hypothetical protein
MRQTVIVLLACGLIFLLVACGDLASEIVGATATPERPTDTPPTATLPPTTEPTATQSVSTEVQQGIAAVDSVDVQMMESFPVQVNARAQGNLPDGCTLIEQSRVEQQENTFVVTISTIRPADMLCTQAVVPFEEIVSLDVEGLPAGTYTVDVNGVTTTFTLDVDNVQPTEPAATPTVADSASAIINGRVWHDLCTVLTDETGGQIALSTGCVPLNEGTAFEANGRLEDGEPGISDITVSLGSGPCPADGLATTLTDADGDYLFEGLTAGDYCVSIDTEAAENAAMLPGVWTYPGVNVTAVTLADGEIKTDVNFGWDFAQLPEPDVDLANCTNSMAFLADLSIPDDTVIAPGETFEKGWRLRNSGTCPWTTGYALTFAGGEQMGAPETAPLPNPVAPGEEVSVFIDFVAPETVGTYRSDWLMTTAAGQIFGVDGFADQVIWTQIVVGVPEPTAEPNSAAIGGVVWEDICFIRADGSPSPGCVEIEGTGQFRGDGSLINEPRLAGVTVILAEGACPDTGAPLADAILQTAVTDADGLYRFTNLDEGLYCVAIDALSPANVNLFIPGNWTWPAPGTGGQGVNLAAGEQRLEVDFGWDYQE